MKPLRKGQVKLIAEALYVSEFGGYKGRCPMCAGWNLSTEGETAGEHTPTCKIGRAVRIVKEALDPAPVVPSQDRGTP